MCIKYIYWIYLSNFMCTDILLACMCVHRVWRPWRSEEDFDPLELGESSPKPTWAAPYSSLGHEWAHTLESSWPWADLRRAAHLRLFSHTRWHPTPGTFFLGSCEDFPLHTLPMDVARQQGDKSIRCDRLPATLCLFLPTQCRAAFLWGFTFKSKEFLSLFLCLHH